MATVTITNAAMDAIRSMAELPFRQEGVRVGPGEWRVPLSDETIERIESQRMKGETFSDCILRVVKTAGRKPQ